MDTDGTTGAGDALHTREEREQEGDDIGERVGLRIIRGKFQN